jgi:hypothetical protein
MKGTISAMRKRPYPYYFQAGGNGLFSFSHRSHLRDLIIIISPEVDVMLTSRLQKGKRGWKTRWARH